MPTRTYETKLNATPEVVWQFHASAEALQVLTPPSRKVEFLSDDLAVREGAIQTIRARQFGIPMVWKVRLTEVNPPYGFRDTALKSPFAEWSHHHEFLPHEGGTLLRDTVTYRVPLGPLGQLADLLFVHRQLDELFEFRHGATREALAK